MSAIEIARVKALGQSVVVFSKDCVLIPLTHNLNPAKAPRKRGK